MLMIRKQFGVIVLEFYRKLPKRKEFFILVVDLYSLEPPSMFRFFDVRVLLSKTEMLRT